MSRTEGQLASGGPPHGNDRHERDGTAMNATAAKQHETLVLGAGYAGLSAAIQLAARTRKRGNLRVTLVNPYDTFTERLRLHMTATGQETAEMNIPELLDGTGAAFVRGWVTAVDAEAKT